MPTTIGLLLSGDLQTKGPPESPYKKTPLDRPTYSSKKYTLQASSCCIMKRPLPAQICESVKTTPSSIAVLYVSLHFSRSIIGKLILRNRRFGGGPPYVRLWSCLPHPASKHDSLPALDFSNQPAK